MPIARSSSWPSTRTWPVAATPCKAWPSAARRMRRWGIGSAATKTRWRPSMASLSVENHGGKSWRDRDCHPPMIILWLMGWMVLWCFLWDTWWKWGCIFGDESWTMKELGIDSIHWIPDPGKHWWIFRPIGGSMDFFHPKKGNGWGIELGEAFWELKKDIFV